MLLDSARLCLGSLSFARFSSVLICSDRICPALRGLALSYSDLQAFAQQCSALLGVARPYSDLLDVAHFPRRFQLLAFARAWLTVLGVSWAYSA